VSARCGGRRWGTSRARRSPRGEAIDEEPDGLVGGPRVRGPEAVLVHGDHEDAAVRRAARGGRPDGGCLIRLAPPLDEAAALGLLEELHRRDLAAPAVDRHAEVARAQPEERFAVVADDLYVERDHLDAGLELRRRLEPRRHQQRRQHAGKLLHSDLIIPRSAYCLLPTAQWVIAYSSTLMPNAYPSTENV
jgi:hypothetical protein